MFKKIKITKSLALKFFFKRVTQKGLLFKNPCVHFIHTYPYHGKKYMYFSTLVGKYVKV